MPSDLTYYAFSDDTVAQKVATYAREHPKKVRQMLGSLRGYGATPTTADVQQMLLDFLQQFPPSQWDELSADQRAYVQLHRAALESIIARTQGDAAVTTARARLAQAVASANQNTVTQAIADTQPTFMDTLLGGITGTARTVALGVAAVGAFLLYREIRKR